MAFEVFISYARSTSAAAAKALKVELGESAFLDTNEIQPGQKFPPEIFKRLLESRVVVVFADATYFQQWYCLRELETALQPFLRAEGEAARAESLGHIIVVLPADAKDVDTNHLPPELRNGDWPRASELPRQVALIRERLDASPAILENRIAREILHELLDRAAKPPPLNLASATLPVFPMTLSGSLQEDFIGRADELALIHFVLSTARGTAASAALTGSIEGFGGMGKTRLALEYVHRYGPKHFPGGIFWVDGETSEEALQSTFHGILVALQEQSRHRALMGQTVPSTFKAFVEEGRDARRELARALQAVADQEPILYVVDNVPEPGLTDDEPKPLDTWCPARQKVALLVTSRQNLSAAGGGIHGLQVEELPAEAAVQLLTRNVPKTNALTRDEWREVAEWVGRHPLALDLLNQVLRRRSGMEAEELLRGVREASPTRELEEKMQTLVRAKVALPELLKGKRAGVLAAFAVSYRRLSEPAQVASQLVALLAPSPIPNALLKGLEAAFSPEARAELMDRHFVVPFRSPAGPGAPTMFGSMHRLVADFLRAIFPVSSESWGLIAMAVSLALDRAYDGRDWTLVESCVLHGLFVRALAPSTEPSEMDQPRGQLCQALSNALVLLGRREEALECIREAVEVGRRLATGKAEAFESILATCLNNLSNCLGEFGKHEEALRAIEESVEIRTRLAKAAPSRFEPDLATALNTLSNRLREVGKREEALRAVEEAVRMRRRLVNVQPEEFEPRLMGALNNLSVQLNALGKREEALRAIEEAIAIGRRLAEARPEAFQPDLGMLLNTLSNMLGELGRRKEALSAIQESVEIRTRLAEARPEAFVSDLAKSLNNLSARLSELGKREEALRAIQKAVDVHRRLAIASPEVFEAALATSLHNFSSRLSEFGKHQEALAAAEEAVEIRRRLARASPTAFEPDLAASLNNLSNRLSQLAKRKEALTAIEEAVAIRTRLAKSWPETFEPVLAGTLNNLSHRLSALGRWAEALKAIQGSVEIRRRLAVERPEATEPELALSLTNLSIHLGETGRNEEALNAAREAVVVYRRLVERLPEVFTEPLAHSLRVLSMCARILGRAEEAEEVNAEIAKIGREASPGPS
ncbi:MAG TPA: tetratricopeptide repeat protein [Myxococcaceae bacterium]|nr:tetratricopeptide repeat protein [Myxococcaceae bacterium]